MENLWKIPMENQHQNVENLWKNPQQILSENAFRILKVLVQLEKNKPGKVKVKDIRKIIVDLSESEIYESLKELEKKRFVEHKQPYWLLKGITEVKPSKFGLFEYWHRKAEREQRERLLIHRENLLKAAQYCELLVKFYPEEMAAFGELAKNYREEMKEIDKVLEVVSK